MTTAIRNRLWKAGDHNAEPDKDKSQVLSVVPTVEIAKQTRFTAELMSDSECAAAVFEWSRRITGRAGISYVCPEYIALERSIVVRS